MATDEDYPIDLSILVIEAQIFVAVKKFPFLPNKLIPTRYLCIRINVDVGMNLSDKFRFLFCILLSNFQQFYLFGPACLK